MPNELKELLEDMAKKRDFEKRKIEKALDIEIEKIIKEESK